MPRSSRVLVDTNVALDLLLGREPFLLDAVELFALAEADALKLWVSADAISTIGYIIHRNQGERRVREAISKLLDYVKIAALDERTILHGLTLDFDDLEDALVCAVAMRERFDVIVTRNKRDFKHSSIPVMEPREFLAAEQAKRRSGN